MPELTVIVDDAHLNEVKTILNRDYGATVSQVIQTEWEGAVSLEQLREYYEGDYRRTETCQAIIASGRRPVCADDMDEADWTEFANDLQIYEQNGDPQLFRPSPGIWHNYDRWFEQPAED